MLQSYFPEWVIQTLMGAGVLIASVIAGLRLFGAGQRANAPERRSAAPDLRKALGEMHADQVARHDETHQRLEAHGVQLAVILALINRGE